MGRRLAQIFLITSLVAIAIAIAYLVFIAPSETFYLERLLDRQMDVRWLGVIGLALVGLNNFVLLALTRIDLSRYALKLKLDSQALIATHDELPVILQVHENLLVPVDEMIDVEAPIDQTAPVQITDVVEVPVDIAIPMPIDEVVQVEALVPIHTTIPVDAMLEAPVLGKLVKIPLHLEVPLDLKIPVSCKARIRKPDFVVHVKDQIPLKVDKAVAVHVKTILKTCFPFKKEIRVPVDIELKSKVKLDQSEPIKVQGEFTLAADSLKMRVVPEGK